MNPVRFIYPGGEASHLHSGVRYWECKFLPHDLIAEAYEDATESWGNVGAWNRDSRRPLVMVQDAFILCEVKYYRIRSSGN